MRVLVILAFVLAAATHSPPRDRDPGLWGFALGLHGEEASQQGFGHPPDSAPLLGLGANAILLSPSWEQEDIHATELSPGPVRDVELRRTIRRAHALDLDVVLAPWVALRHADEGEWRGRLRPRQRGLWWRSYERFILHYATLARDERVRVLSIGSELSSLGDDPHWPDIARRVRQTFEGQITFIANHDALDVAPFAHVDIVGVSAYFPLTKGFDGEPRELDEAWASIALRLRRLKTRHRKPLVIFEVGYPSREGGAMRPWDDTTGAPVDLEEQRRAYAALDHALGHADWLDGLFFWTWFGPGGPHDRHYTPRGKPAETIARAFLGRRTDVRRTHAREQQ